MNIQAKSSHGITVIPTEAKLFEKRKIFIKGKIEFEAADELASKIIILALENNTAPIDVIINSTGGEVQAGLAMYDIISSCSIPIRTFCIGGAYSMAAILFAAGTGGRFMLPHSELMLHEPLLGSKVSGSASSIRSISDTMMETKKKVNQILAKLTGKSEDAVERATNYDHYFTPKESIAFGLADKIVDFNKLMEVNYDLR